MGPSGTDAARRLRDAELEVVGRFATASNATLLVRLRGVDGCWPELPLDDEGDLLMGDLAPQAFAVYKPQRGEAPLWDFPPGTLYRREVAAYEVDRLLGWNMVPVTVVRDGPFGVGAVQQFVPHDPERHYFALLEDGDPAIVGQLQRMVLFDVAIDNADRKGGHVLLADGRVQLVDHGVSFNVVRKLRTVAWHFAGQLVPTADRAEMGRVAALLGAGGPGTARLRDLLADEEYERLCQRAAEAAELRTFPPPMGSRPYPWPLV